MKWILFNGKILIQAFDDPPIAARPMSPSPPDWGVMTKKNGREKPDEKIAEGTESSVIEFFDPFAMDWAIHDFLRVYQSFQVAETLGWEHIKGAPNDHRNIKRDKG